jgi:hypothetical protein
MNIAVGRDFDLCAQRRESISLMDLCWLKIKAVVLQTTQGGEWEVISQIDADGAARDLGRPPGASRGHPREWVVTDEQRRGRPKDRPFPCPRFGGFLFPATLLFGFRRRCVSASICEVASALTGHHLMPNNVEVATPVFEAGRLGALPGSATIPSSQMDEISGTLWRLPGIPAHANLGIAVGKFFPSFLLKYIPR